MIVLVCEGCGMKFRVSHPRSRDAAAAFKDWHSRYGCSVLEMEERDAEGEELRGRTGVHS